MNCNECKQKAIVYATKPLTDLTTRTYYECSNVACRHKFSTLQSFEKTITPPANKIDHLIFNIVMGMDLDKRMELLDFIKQADIKE